MSSSAGPVEGFDAPATAGRKSARAAAMAADACGSMGVAEATATASESVSTMAGPASAADFAEADDDTVAALVALTVT